MNENDSSWHDSNARLNLTYLSVTSSSGWTLQVVYKLTAFGMFCLGPLHICIPKSICWVVCSTCYSRASAIYALTVGCFEKINNSLSQKSCFSNNTIYTSKSKLQHRYKIWLFGHSSCNNLVENILWSSRFVSQRVLPTLKLV